MGNPESLLDELGYIQYICVCVCGGGGGGGGGRWSQCGDRLGSGGHWGSGHCEGYGSRGRSASGALVEKNYNPQ